MAQEAQSKKYQWNMGMTCNACVGQLENILKKVNSKLEDDKQFTYTVSLDNKTVVVEGASVDSDAIGAKLQKWADLKEKSYEFKGQV